jgi:aminoglycoside phosphotransferase (APT) family kinase protein
MGQGRNYTDFEHLRFLAESNLNSSGVMPCEIQLDGKILPVEKGLYHNNYRFGITGTGLPKHIEERYLFLRLIPERGNDRSISENIASLKHEIETLKVVADAGFEFDAPRFVCEVKDDSGDLRGFIETCMDGIPLTTFTNSANVDKAIRRIGQVAAAVHKLPATPLGHLKSFDNSRLHILDDLNALPLWLTEEYAVARKAIDWIRAHLPDRSSTVLHGDLLPQNILCDIMDGEQLSLVDWEFARIGDPAYDLAIVTRGQRKLLGKTGAARILLESYNSAGCTGLTMRDIRVHEIILVLNWLVEKREAENKGDLSGESSKHYAKMVERLLRSIE